MISKIVADCKESFRMVNRIVVVQECDATEES
jgi:hypothetical protein